jgi:hypothetical protein
MSPTPVAISPTVAACLSKSSTNATDRSCRAAPFSIDVDRTSTSPPTVARSVRKLSAFWREISARSRDWPNIRLRF